MSRISGLPWVLWRRVVGFCCHGLEEDLWQRDTRRSFGNVLSILSMQVAGSLRSLLNSGSVSSRSYTWRRQARIDAGIEPGLSTAEHAELGGGSQTNPGTRNGVGGSPSRHRAVEGGNQPKRRFAAIKVMAAEGLPIEKTRALLGVSVSGYYSWLRRAPSQRSIRHAWLTDLIRQVHADSRQTYGSKRVHAELTLGRGISVGREAVTMLMHRAGIQGLSGRPRYRNVPNVATASDLVDRKFGQAEPDRLWVTDITEHPTREGKVYCAVVLDAFSRRVVGWSIDSRPTAALVTNALGMTIDRRKPADADTVIHSDQGSQAGFKWSSQHLDLGVFRGSSTTSSRPSDPTEVEVTWSPEVPASCRSGVLDPDRHGSPPRGSLRRCRSSSGRRCSLVPRRWGHAAV